MPLSCVSCFGLLLFLHVCACLYLCHSISPPPCLFLKERDRDADLYAGREVGRQANGHKWREGEMHGHKQGGRKAGKKAGRVRGRETSREESRQAGRQGRRHRMRQGQLEGGRVRGKEHRGREVLVLCLFFFSGSIPLSCCLPSFLYLCHHLFLFPYTSLSLPLCLFCSFSVFFFVSSSLANLLFLCL